MQQRCHRHELYRRVSQRHPDLEKELEDVILTVGVGDTKDDKLVATLDKVVFKWAAKHGIDVTPE